MADASPTVILVHGAFADSSSWAGVIERLLAANVAVRAVANPLRGLNADTAYLASVLRQMPGPVLAVGHSYGGAVITNASSMVDNVVGLVYVAAFAPEEGESLLDIEGNSRDSLLANVLVAEQYPVGSGSDTANELSIDSASFHDAFAGDLPPSQTAVMAATQRPASEAVFAEKTSVPAWKTLPSWAVVATGDRAAGSDVVLSMAKRANAQTIEVEGSHVIMMSQPQIVTDTIVRALQSVS
jgi:pimeloyl-ACP methyl ester carboxylesterase